MARRSPYRRTGSPTRRVNGTDVAIIQLSATLGELTNNGVRSYQPAALLPAGRSVTNVGVPVGGVPAGQVAPRAGLCVTGHHVGVIEFGWFFDDSQAVDCPGILDGSSGSPLFDRTDRVVGMINTTTVGARPGGACWLDNPCERTENGAVPVPDTSYAIAVDGLQSCFPNGYFALTDSCPLPRPGVVVKTTVAAVNADGNEITAQVTTPTATTLRTGVAKLTDADSCAEDTTYTATVAAGSGPTTIKTTIPAEEGFYVWCIASQSAAGPTSGGPASGGPATRPARVVLQRDLTPPVRTPRLSVDETDAGYRVTPVLSPPELSGFRIKVGPPASTDCADATGYQQYRLNPIVIPTRQLPVVFCYVGADLAGNETPAFSRTLG